MSPLDNSPQPSMAINKISFKGTDNVIGLIIIIPNANKMHETTKSITIKGK